jgi:hypothetical protein
VTFLQFLEAHKVALAIAGGWTFSALCSTMPPLPEKAGYMLTWAHNFLQAAAANLNKVKNQGDSDVIQKRT